MPRPAIVTIHLPAIRHNYAIAQSKVQSKVWAVIKANGYGHGIEAVFKALPHADGFALVEVDNAVQLRALGWCGPILLLQGFFDRMDLSVIIKHNIEVVVHSDWQIELLKHWYDNEARLETHHPIRIHLKVNTGMNRLGFSPDKVAQAYQALLALKKVEIVTLTAHFANADQAQIDALEVSVLDQLRQFESAHGAIKQKTGVSLSNSAAILLHGAIQNDWARAGIMLYGGTPSNSASIDVYLQPAMTLSSEIIAVQTLQKGDKVGYGSRFMAEEAMQIGVVACGYADGYPRHAIDGTPILVEGVRTRMVGRVSMDLITVDITHIPNAQIGSPVVMWGKGLPIDEVASYADTIGYELMCGVTKRVRVLLEEA